MSIVLLGSRRLACSGGLLKGNSACFSFSSSQRSLPSLRSLTTSGKQPPPSPPRFEKIIKVRLSKQEAPEPPVSRLQLMMKNFLGPKPMPERYTAAWYGEMLLVCTVFAITGSSTMLLVRPAVKDVLGIQGSFRDGPWTYRLSSLFIMSPVYAGLLVGVGTVFGRHFYFRRFAIKLISRFGIPPESLDKNWYKHDKHFRKW